MNDIFIEEDGKVVLAKDYLRSIPEFRILLEKKVLQKGDVQGALKKENFKWFAYIKIVADLFSYPNQEGLNDKEVRRIACKEAGLDEDYKPDVDVENAIIKYRKIQNACLPTLNTVNGILRGLNLSDKIIKGLTDNMEYQIALFNKNVDKDTINETSLAENMMLMDAILKQLDSLNKIAISVPKIIETMEGLKQKIEKEEAGVNVMRGGRELSEFANERN